MKSFSLPWKRRFCFTGGRLEASLSDPSTEKERLILSLVPLFLPFPLSFLCPSIYPCITTGKYIKCFVGTIIDGDCQIFPAFASIAFGRSEDGTRVFRLCDK
ncbi:mCG1048419, isoform CRA_a [Mus musculus]|nr:mCG1048419, isoform CRA_a [Mus musculus]EDL20781.1 mCG1048419, isoform CRA_a [Mus musculus]